MFRLPNLLLMLMTLSVLAALVLLSLSMPLAPDLYLYGALRAAARAFAAPAATDVAFAAAAFAAFAGVAVRMFVSMSFLHPFVSLTFAALAGAVAALGARRGRG